MLLRCATAAQGLLPSVLVPCSVLLHSIIFGAGKRFWIFWKADCFRFREASFYQAHPRTDASFIDYEWTKKQQPRCDVSRSQNKAVKRVLLPNLPSYCPVTHHRCTWQSTFVLPLTRTSNRRNIYVCAAVRNSSESTSTIRRR